MRPRRGKSPARGRVPRRAAISALLITSMVKMVHDERLIAADSALQPGHPEALPRSPAGFHVGRRPDGAHGSGRRIGLWLARDWGRLLEIVAASALVHMGFFDVALHGQYGMYTSLDPVTLEARSNTQLRGS